MSECWCVGGTKGYSQHIQRKNRTEPCAESRQANTTYHRAYAHRRREHINEYNRTHVNGWIPGSEVDLSDDAL